MKLLKLLVSDDPGVIPLGGMINPEPVLLFASGPSGSGKSTLIQKAKECRRNLGVSRSTTTRLPRIKKTGSAQPEMEVSGVDYDFVDDHTFERMEAMGEFVECQPVHGRYYGTPWKSIKEQWDKGLSIIGDIDVQGVRKLMRLDHEKIEERLATVFISAPSVARMQTQMLARDRNFPFEEQLKRIETAKEEIPYAHLFDHVIVNDVFEDSLNEFVEYVDVLTAPMMFQQRRERFLKLRERRQAALDFLQHQFDWNVVPHWATQSPSAGYA
ncbi:MAG: hypothetical protein V4664_02570 [Patescibacteria group bacterium]